MSKLDYTPQNISESISTAEQLSLAALMVLDQRCSDEELVVCLQPLLSKLNYDLGRLKLLDSLAIGHDLSGCA